MDTVTNQIVDDQTGWSFDPATHLYRVGGRVVPGATEILKDAGFSYPGNANGMAMGTGVHLATQFYDEGNLDIKSVSDDIYGYLSAWIKFRQETDFKPTRIEESNVHMTLGFGATLDREGTWNQSKGHVLVEIKKYCPPHFTGLQLALQDLTLPKLALPRKRIAVELKVNGEYRIHRYDDKSEISMALFLISLYWYKRNGV